MNPPSRATLFILNNITHIASLLLPCVSRYAAVAKNSHCTQSIQNIVVSYHAHCLPRVGLEYRHTLRPTRNSHCTQSYSKCVDSYHAHCEPFAPLRISIRGVRKKIHTARNLIQNELIHITHIAHLLLPCVSRYVAVAKNSHCTQSYSKYVESYHAHWLPREGLSIDVYNMPHAEQHRQCEFTL